MTPVTDSSPEADAAAPKRDIIAQVAKLAEYTERYDDMAKFMKQLVELSDGNISTEERNLLSVAYKQVVAALRSAFRVIASIERSETAATPAAKKRVLADYREDIKKEVREVCAEVIELLEKFLVNKAADAESKIFFLKMKGDYCRYVAEVADAAAMDEIVERSRKAYQDALDIATQKMVATHPVRLGLALNFSVFHYEIANAAREAIELAKKSFNEAVAELDNLSEDAYKDSTCIMQLLRDNLTLWNAIGGDDEQEGGEQQVPATSVESVVEDEQTSVPKTEGGAEQINTVDSSASDAKEGEQPTTTEPEAEHPVKLQDA